MNIRKIELNNFKSYYGHNSIDFNEGLNVISGMIGTGKTSLFDAFEWIFKHSSLDPSLDKDSKLVNAKKAFECDIDSNVEASVVLHINYKKTTYSFKKALRFKKGENDKLIQPSLELSLSHKDEKTQNFEYSDNPLDFKEKLNEIVPPTLLNYILFKGENVEKLINFQNKATLADAVDKVSYYPHYVKLLETIVDFERKSSNKLAQKLKLTKRNKKEVEENEFTIDRLTRAIEGIKEDITELKERIEAKKEAEDKLEVQLKAITGIPEKLTEINNLKNDLRRVLSKIEQADLQSSERFINKWIFVKAQPLLDEFNSEFKRFNDERNKKAEELKKHLAYGVPGDQLIDQMIRDCNCYICGRDFKKNSDEEKVILSHKNDRKVENLSPEMHELALMFGNLNNSLSINNLKQENLVNDFIQFRRDLNELENQRELIASKLNMASDDLKQTLKERGVNEAVAKGSANYFKRWKEMQAERVELEAKLNAKGGRLIQMKNELTKATANRTKYASTPNGEKLSEDYLNQIANALKKSMEQLVKDERERILQEIEKAANDMISDIIDSSKSVNNIITVKVKINLISCKVQFTDLNGEPTIPHGAQDELAKLAVISAVLSITSKYLDQDYTFIVDAPASRFDSTIFKPYFETTAKNFKQSIVVLKDIHDSLDEYQNNKAISNLILLNKNTTGKEEASMTNSFTQITQL